MAELLIRAGHNDHTVIADLLAPGGAVALHRPIDRLVANAQTAARRSELAQHANLAGVPYIVDPLTPLLQVDVDPDDAWVRRLSYGRAQLISPGEMSDYDKQRLVAEVVESEQQLGATVVVPPYLLASGPEDPAFAVSLEFMATTARYMRRHGVNLPLLPVFCGTHRAFAAESAWRDGIDRFTAAAADLGPQTVALCLTPVGNATDSYAKVLRYFLTAQRVKRAGMTTLAWRQGVLGVGITAAGLDGYETGIGTGEKADVRDMIARRKPRAGGQTRGGGSRPMVYLEPLGRSVPRDVAETLLADRNMRARLICDDETCCPHGVNSMLDDPRPHAVRSRARRLAALADMPHRSWRLHQVAKEAKTAAGLAKRGTLVLRAEGIDTKLHATAQDALARVAEFLRRNEGQQLTA
jgi:hypothetical protein